jgi:anti-anti-sigma regulatory factor
MYDTIHYIPDRKKVVHINDDFEIEVSEFDEFADLLLITPKGYSLGGRHADMFEWCQEAIGAGVRHIIIDMSNHPYRSSGLQSVFFGLDRLAKEKQIFFCLIGVDPDLMQIYESTGLLMMLRTFDSFEDAVLHMSSDG